MKLRVTGLSTEKDSINDADVINILKQSGVYAGICYMPNTYDVLEADSEGAIKRVYNALKKGHHSVMCHIHMTIVLEGIPKILAILLNSVKFYNTSEKSGRYTVMTGGDSDENTLYNKWRVKIGDLIKKEYPDFKDSYIDNLAKENARYFISVFSPTTTMAYTTSIQGWNYIYDWCKMLIEEVTFQNGVSDYQMAFFKRLIPYLEELRSLLKPYIIDNLRDRKRQGFKLFDLKKEYEEVRDYFGHVYSTSYDASFVALAQLNRHRTLTYRIHFKDELEYYIPDIIKKYGLEDSWCKDLESVEFPNAMLLNVVETGDYTDFKLKCTERLCGRAQYETAKIVTNIYKKFAINAPHLGFSKDIPTKGSLLNGCTEPCVWSCKNGVNFRYRIV